VEWVEGLLGERVVRGVVWELKAGINPGCKDIRSVSSRASTVYRKSLGNLACLLIFEKYFFASTTGLLVGEVASTCRSTTENNVDKRVLYAVDPRRCEEFRELVFEIVYWKTSDASCREATHGCGRRH
jgi:hypothetical protein